MTFVSATGSLLHWVGGLSYCCRTHLGPALCLGPRVRRRPSMSTLLLLSSSLQPSADVLPGLGLLPHQVKILPAEGSALLEAPDVDLVLVDGRRELAHARDLCRLIRTTGSDVPVLLVVT